MVIVTDRIATSAAAAAQEIVRAGGQAEAHVLDMENDAALTAAIVAAANRYGRIDILHSHAGIQIPGRLEEVTPDQMDASWRLMCGRISSLHGRRCR